MSDAHWLNPEAKDAEEVASDLLAGQRKGFQKRGLEIASCGQLNVREASLRCFVVWRADGTAVSNSLFVVDRDAVLTLSFAPALSQEAEFFKPLVSSRLGALRSKVWD
jgi:hypothetical protein